MTTENRENFIRIVESESLIDGVFYNVKRIGENGGNGFFSVVFSADVKGSSKKAALKFYDPDKRNIKVRLDRFYREIDFIEKFKDEPYVINSIGNGGVRELKKEFKDSTTGFTFVDIFPFIAIEKADGNVEDLIYSEEMDALKCLYLFRKIVKCVFRIHNRGYCHRDLKPDNFLIIGDDVLLSDLGTAKHVVNPNLSDNDNYSFAVGNRQYWAPELFFNLGIADSNVYSSDIYSLGAIIFEIFSKNVLSNYFYTQSFWDNLEFINNVIHRMSAKNRLKSFNELEKDLINITSIPAIYSLNDFVPNSIKLHLNNLYMSLIEVNPIKRIKSHPSIYRKIDICIKILENQEKYNVWLQERRKRWKIRMEKKKERRHINDF